MVRPELAPTGATAATTAAPTAARATHTDRRAGAPAAQSPRTTEDQA